MAACLLLAGALLAGPAMQTVSAALPVGNSLRCCACQAQLISNQLLPVMP
jgi:hypothetical protein